MPATSAAAPSRAAADLPARPDRAVRVLHTSDWHLGVAVRNEPRDIDHDAVIAEIVTVAESAEPDLIVHTGDLFHGGRPGMADFARAIRALRSLGKIAPVVVLAGNHDSSVALETLGVAVSDPVPALVADGTWDPYLSCPAPIRVLHRPAIAAGGAVATYPTAAGGRLRLAALPFLHANRVMADFDDIVGSHGLYTDSIRKICGSFETVAFDGGFDPASDVAVFASHLHVEQARTSSEKEIHVSSEYATDPAHLSNRYGYFAFGHIHIAQAVAAGRGRYAGSILEVDFGEEGETKQVVVADLTPGRPTRIHDVALTAGRRLHRIRSPYSTLADHADTVGDGLVEVTVALEPKPTTPLDEVTDAADTSVDTTNATANDAAIDDPDEVNTHCARVELDIPGFDTLTDAVRDALPDATIVAVVDARRPDTAVVDETDRPDVPDSPSELYRGWFAEAGAALIARADAHNADPARITDLFAEFHHGVTTDTDPEIAELVAVRAMVEED